MGLFFYTKIGSIIFIGDLPTTNIIEPLMKATKGQANPQVALKLLAQELAKLKED